jgi:hypothetical protein
MPESPVSCLCPKTGALICRADKPRLSQKRSPLRGIPEQAKQMVERAQAAGLPIRLRGRGYRLSGHSPDLRVFLEEQGDAYAASRPLHRSRVCADTCRSPAQ